MFRWAYSRDEIEGWEKVGWKMVGARWQASKSVWCTLMKLEVASDYGVEVNAQRSQSPLE